MSGTADLVQTPASRIALYEGIIALAWADHELHGDEKTALHGIIESHVGLLDQDRDRLHNLVDDGCQLADVWPRITAAEDRARLIDIANVIFQQDGSYCDTEREVIEQFRSRHLATLDIATIDADIGQLTADQRQRREIEAEELRQYAKQFSLVEQLKSVFRR